MKKVLMIMLIALTSFTATYGFNKEDYYGSWIEDSLQKVVIEITADTIFIDEIGNEGFCYTYTYDSCSNTFTLYDEIDNKPIIVLQFPTWMGNKDKLKVALCSFDFEGYDVFWIDRKL